MSSYIVSDNHINTLISWAAANDVSYRWEHKWIAIKGAEQHAAATLYAANVESVNRLYKGAAPSAAFTYRHVWTGRLSALSILRACATFDYQACEVDVYESTVAAKIIDAIRHAAIKGLPGYHDAPRIQ